MQTVPDARKEGSNYGFSGWPTYAEILEDGEGREETQAICSACHSTAYIIGQPPLNGETWGEIVDKMINAFGATIPPADHPKIVGYLTAHYGLSRHPPADTTATESAGHGAQVYQSNCVPCHQATGLGIPTAFPPLAGHVPDLLRQEAGRKYLPHVLLYGLQGPIVIKGTSFNNAMPPFYQLSDGDVAAVLNYIAAAWGNDKLGGQLKSYLPQDIAAERGAKGSPQSTRMLRP